MKIGIFRENLRISFRAIKSNKVRAILTICIIAFGIMALVGLSLQIIFIDNLKLSPSGVWGMSKLKIQGKELLTYLLQGG